MAIVINNDSILVHVLFLMLTFLVTQLSTIWISATSEKCMHFNTTRAKEEVTINYVTNEPLIDTHQKMFKDRPKLYFNVTVYLQQSNTTKFKEFQAVDTGSEKFVVESKQLIKICVLFFIPASENHNMRLYSKFDKRIGLDVVTNSQILEEMRRKQVKDPLIKAEGLTKKAMAINYAQRDSEYKNKITEGVIIRLEKLAIFLNGISVSIIVIANLLLRKSIFNYLKRMKI